MATDSLHRDGFVVALAAALLSTLAATTASAGGGTEINTGYFGRVAIQGYDPVAYFTPGKATKGSEEHSLRWLGAEWHFATEENKQTFAASPVRYVPQYGGHCAVGVAFGEVTTEIDPEAFAIINGKLYLNYSQSVNETMKADDGTIVRKADARWRKDVRDAAAQ